jgi:hypothetical protein
MLLDAHRGTTRRPEQRRGKIQNEIEANLDATPAPYHLEVIECTRLIAAKYKMFALRMDFSSDRRILEAFWNGRDYTFSRGCCRFKADRVSFARHSLLNGGIIATRRRRRRPRCHWFFYEDPRT